MVSIRRKRFLLDIEAKIVASPVNRLRFLVVRYPRNTGDFLTTTFRFERRTVLQQKTGGYPQIPELA